MIWCVEDDASIRDIEVYALRSTGFEATGFEDGTSFWQALQNEVPELVVLDVMLPGLDGIELLRRMRAEGQLPVVNAGEKPPASALFDLEVRAGRLYPLFCRSGTVPDGNAELDCRIFLKK